MDNELEPCPFCGSKRIYQEYTHILCPDCGCIGPEKHVEGECVDPYVVWNKRHFPEGCTSADARHLREANHDLAVERHELSDLLYECYKRFKQYDMDNAEPDMVPYAHIEFMKRVEAALGV